MTIPRLLALFLALLALCAPGDAYAQESFGWAFAVSAGVGPTLSPNSGAPAAIYGGYVERRFGAWAASGSVSRVILGRSCFISMPPQCPNPVAAGWTGMAGAKLALGEGVVQPLLGAEIGVARWEQSEPMWGREVSARVVEPAGSAMAGVRLRLGPAFADVAGQLRSAPSLSSLGASLGLGVRL